jgi:hypothetical protein
MKQLYIDIRDRLTSEVTQLQTVRLFNNQFERSNNDDSGNNDEQAFPYPAAFIEFPDDNLVLSSSYGVRILDVLVRVHIGIETYELEDLDLLDLIETVKSKLQGYSTTKMSELQYYAQRPDYNHNNVYIYQLDFKTKYMDDNNYTKDKGETVAGGTITPVITIDLDLDNFDIRTGDGTI